MNNIESGLTIRVGQLYSGRGEKSMAENTADAVGASQSYLSEGTRAAQRISSLGDATKKNSSVAEMRPEDTVPIMEEINRRRENGEFTPVDGQKVDKGGETGAPTGEEKPSEIKTGPAVWKNKDSDQPVIVTGSLGKGDDGREYVSVEGSAAGVPLDEIKFPQGDKTGKAKEQERYDEKFDQMADESKAKTLKMVDEIVDKADWPTVKTEDIGESGESMEEIMRDDLYSQKFGKSLLEAELNGEVVDKEFYQRLKKETLESYRQEKTRLSEEEKRGREEWVQSLDDWDQKIDGTNNVNEKEIYKLLKERWQPNENLSCKELEGDFLLLKADGSEALVKNLLGKVTDSEGKRIYDYIKIEELVKDKNENSFYKNVEREVIPQLLLRKMAQPDFDLEEFSAIENAPWAGEVKEMLLQSIDKVDDSELEGINGSPEYKRAKDEAEKKDKGLIDRDSSWMAFASVALDKLGIKGVAKPPAKIWNWLKKDTVKKLGVGYFLLHAPFGIILVGVGGYYLYKNLISKDSNSIGKKGKVSKTERITEEDKRNKKNEKDKYK